jgi:hypothetical protein
VGVEFADEGTDDGLGGVEDVEAADVVKQLAELVVDLSLVLVLLVFFLDFPLEHLEEFGLEQHFFDSDEDFQDHLKDLTLCEFEPDAVGNGHLVVDQLVFV